MKKRTMITAAFAALLAVATIGTAVTANAADVGAGPSSLGGTGKVTITQGSAGPDDPMDPEVPVDPINPDPDHVTPTPDTGTLIIQQVSVLDFGTLATGTTAKTVSAAAVPLTTTAGDSITRGNFVQFTDIRNNVYGYTVTAALTKQFTDTTDSSKVLTGSTISFANPILSSIQPTDNIPATITPTFTLAEGADGKAGASSTVISNPTADKKGKGTYSLEFGQSATWTDTAANHQGTGTAGTAANSVNLTVPADTRSSMVLGDYTATITWTIAAIPA